MRIKSWLLALAAFAVSLPALAQEFQGKAIFSVEFVEAADGLVDDTKPKGRTGIFYYYKEGPGEYGSTITGYRLRNGAVVDVAGSGGVDTAAFIAKLNALSLASFDVEQEINTAIRIQRTRGFHFVVTDGAKYWIHHDFNGVRFDYTGWNPGPHIRSLAQDSANLKKLDELLDLFAVQFGRRQFGL